MPFLVILLLLTAFGVAFNVKAATCEFKQVCVDNNHVGFQDTECKITTAEEFYKSLGGDNLNGTYLCYVGCKDGECITDNTPYTCTDTDGGNDYFVKGSVATKGNGEQATGADYCTDKDNLLETNCSKDSTGKYTIKMTPYKCPNGCLNGACIKNTSGGTGSICTDSDGGKDIFKAGTITINGKKQNTLDSCWFDPQTINEKFCLPDGTYASEDMKCPGLCELEANGGAYCSNSCEKSRGYYCYKSDFKAEKVSYGIAFLTNDCKWEKITPCQSNGCSTGLCMTVGNLVDTDGDGLLDVNEAKWGTDPNKFDTDGDGYGDMTEIVGGYNPLGDGKFTSEQAVLAGQMASIGNATITTNTSNNASSSVVASTTVIVNSSDTEIIKASSLAAISQPLNTPNPSNALPGITVYYLIALIIAISVIFYIYCALCLQFIAKKLVVAGIWMAWVPIANIFLTIKCAGRPGWWFLLLFVPLANVVILVIVWMDIAEMLGEPKWLGILIIINPLNLIMMGYLAFSKHRSTNSPDSSIQPQS